jgi:hypothetical protein
LPQITQKGHKVFVIQKFKAGTKDVFAMGISLRKICAVTGVTPVSQCVRADGYTVRLCSSTHPNYVLGPVVDVQFQCPA